jgi:hypothetical protein
MEVFEEAKFVSVEVAVPACQTSPASTQAESMPSAITKAWAAESAAGLEFLPPSRATFAPEATG